MLLNELIQNIIHLITIGMMSSKTIRSRDQRILSGIWIAVFIQFLTDFSKSTRIIPEMVCIFSFSETIDQFSTTVILHYDHGSRTIIGHELLNHRTHIFRTDIRRLKFCCSLKCIWINQLHRSIISSQTFSCIDRKNVRCFLIETFQEVNRTTISGKIQ